MEKIANDYLTIQVSDLGAELSSIKDENGREYLWQGDKRYWGRRSPILFLLLVQYGTTLSELTERNTMPKDTGLRAIRSSNSSSEKTIGWFTVCMTQRKVMKTILSTSFWESATNWKETRYTSSGTYRTLTIKRFTFR